MSDTINQIDLAKGRPLSLAFPNVDFTPGELYLFHATDKECPVEGAMWGVFDKYDDGRLYLESASFDLIHFAHWMPLGEEYGYCRVSSREELRDYVAAATFAECHHHAV